jgi:hypothetical protein
VLPRNHRQEAFCHAYLQAVAARCGLTLSVANYDYGIDLTLREITRRNGHFVESGFKLDIQAKSTTKAQAIGGHVIYDLSVRAYDVLRNEAVCSPRMLVLFALPENEADWTRHSEKQMQLHCGAYWLSLRGFPPSKNARSVRLRIPRRSLFTPDSLGTFFERVRRGELP